MSSPASAAADLADPETADVALRAEAEALREEVARLKARLAKAEALADSDALTPVKNRRAFMRELKRAMAYLLRYGGKASLLYFDLDGFKGVNDRHGHAGGDAALTAVAERLLAQVRETDVVGRLGGDEFAVILAQADAEAARAKAEALVAAIETAPVAFEGGEIALRVTCGVREIDPRLKPEQALARADAAMFLRKADRGR